MQCATLIVGIGGSMVVIATNSVDMVVVGVIGDAGAGDVLRDVLFARQDMLEMNGGQRHNADDLSNHEKPQKPATKSALNV